MKDYSFIDMHIHTEHSHEERCEITIEKVFEMAQEKAETFKKDSVISVVDHNSILGCIEAQMVAKSGKYKNVKFINGVEFTTDLSEINQIIGKDIFQRCHVLAYNYDETNEELLAYSKVTHINFFVLENVGLQICAARRILIEKFNISIPFTQLLPLTQLTEDSFIRESFIKLIKPYLETQGINATENQLDKMLEPYIYEHVGENRNAKKYGRLKLSEVATLVNNAGGEIVLAHPAEIKINKTESAEYFNVPELTKTCTMVNLLNFNNSYQILDLFFESAKKMNINFSGIEKYSISSIFGRTDISQQKIMEKYNLYATAGSDFHGYSFSPDKDLGQVFAHNVEELYYSSHRNGRNLFITSLPCLDHLIDGEEYKYRDVVIKDGCIKVNAGDLSLYISSVNKQAAAFEEQQSKLKILKQEEQKKNKIIKEIKKINQKTQAQPADNKEFKERITELASIADALTEKIINRKDNPAKQVSILLNINKFAKTVYEGIDKAIQSGKVSKDELKKEINSIRSATAKIKKCYDKVSANYKVVKGFNKNLENAKSKDYLNQIANINVDKLGR